MAKIKVEDTEIRIIQINDNDYISLTDMLRAKDGEYFFYNWLRNRNTIEFLGIWEKVYNPNFNSVEFDRIKIWIKQLPSKCQRMDRKHPCDRHCIQNRSLWWNLCSQRHCYGICNVDKS